MPVAVRDKSQSLATIFDTLHELLSRHAPPFRAKTGTVRNKRDLNLVVPKPVAIPGAYGGKPVDIAMASIIEQKGYVGFYYMPVYVDPTLVKRLSPNLIKLLKGKTCFYVKKLDADLIKDLEVALREGTKLFKKRGWL